MKALIRALSTPAEFCLVLALVFGLSAGHQLWMLFRSERFHFSNQTLITNSLLQLALLATVLWIGNTRGWSPATFGAKISWKGTVSGVLLFVVTFVAELAVMIPVEMLHPEQPGFSQTALAVPVILVVSVVNPVSEELVGTGYVIHTLQGLGMWRAVLVSALLPAIVHMYQGFNGVISRFVFGVVVALAYWRWRQLWPIILAHSLSDFLGFTVFY